MRTELCTFIAILAQDTLAHRQKEWTMTRRVVFFRWCCPNTLPNAMWKKTFRCQESKWGNSFRKFMTLMNAMSFVRIFVITIVLHSSKLLQLVLSGPVHTVVMFQLFCYVIYGNEFEMNSSIINRQSIHKHKFAKPNETDKRRSSSGTIAIMLLYIHIHYILNDKSDLWLAINSSSSSSSSSIDVCKFFPKNQLKSILILVCHDFVLRFNGSSTFNAWWKSQEKNYSAAHNY